METNQKYPHKKFLQDNKEIIAEYPIPELLQKRITGFDELEEDLQHAVDEDKDKLEEKLERLSLELDEDLEEHFEDYLENNEDEKQAEKEEEKEPDAPITPDAPVESEVFDPASTEIEVEPSPEQKEEPPQQEQIRENDPASEIQKEKTDEDILEQFVLSRQRNVTALMLERAGFKTPVQDRKIVVGKYTLSRARYQTIYKISFND